MRRSSRTKHVFEILLGEVYLALLLFALASKRRNGSEVLPPLARRRRGILAVSLEVAELKKETRRATQHKNKMLFRDLGGEVQLKKHYCFNPLTTDRGEEFAFEY